MARETVLEEIDTRIGYLEAYKKGLKTDPEDNVDPKIKANLRDEEQVTDARIEELERLKKIIYES